MENDPLIGRQLGAYLIQAKLGEGGMARVYKAYHARLRRDVAIKVILSQIADQAGFRARFEQEAQVIAQLQHPNIVTVYDFGESGSLTYLVMQFVGGGTLRDQLRGSRSLEPQRAARYALQMARALHHAHLHGIVHRDVKPQNMLVSSTDRNQLLLSDFGIAKLFSSGLEVTLATLTPSAMASDHSLTNVGQIVGTAEYMAPEQVNMKAVDARTDVYALGVVLFQMLTGQVPFQSSSALGLLYQQVNTVPLSARELNPAVPETLAQITARALAKAPEARFQSAEAMAQSLEVILTSLTTNLYSMAPGDYSTLLGPPSNILTRPPQNTPIPAASSYYGQTPPSGVVQAQSIEPAMRVTAGGAGNFVIPAPARSKSKIPLSYIMVALVLVLAIAFSFWHPFITAPGGPGATPTTRSATAFMENFQDNQRNWTVGNLNGLTASLPSNHSYMLTVSDGNTYFPNPAAVGMLPTNFTMSVDMAQNTGSLNIFYGLAFRLKQNGGKVYCYAFAIDSKGDYELLKYNADVSTTPSELWQGQARSAIYAGLNKMNTLIVTVQRNKFSLEINGTSVPLQKAIQSITDSSSPYKGGQLAILVAGPDTSFTVSSMQLTIP
jgi:serine/threonine protein kinase